MVSCKKNKSNLLPKFVKKSETILEFIFFFGDHYFQFVTEINLGNSDIHVKEKLK